MTARLRSSLALIVCAAVGAVMMLLLVIATARAEEPAPGPTVTISAVDAGAELEPVDAGPYRTAGPPAAVLEKAPPAPPATNLPDPVDDPEGYLGVLYDLWRSGAGVVAALALFLALGTYLRRSRGWFKEGYHALVFAGASTGVTTIVAMAATGQPPNAKMIVAILAGSILAAIKTYGAEPAVKP